MLVFYIYNSDRALCEKKVLILRRSENCAKCMKNFGGTAPGTSHCGRVVSQVRSIIFHGSSENSRCPKELSATVEKHRGCCGDVLRRL
jgi:hypothetical protein